MIGTSTDKNFFYNQNAIEIKSNVWMEWNYNTIIQPFVVASTYNKPEYIGPDSGWSATNSSISNGVSSKISRNQARAIPTSDYNWNARSNGSNTVTNFQINGNYSDIASYTHSFSTIKPAGYYKIVFYAKGKLPIVSGNLGNVTTTTATYAGSAGTSSAVYAVQAVGRYGQLANILNANQYELKNINAISATNPVQVTWTGVEGAIGYNIYRKAVNTSKKYDTFAYLGTVQNSTTTYSDKATTIDPFANVNVIEQNIINFTPRISLKEELDNLIPFRYDTYSSDINNGGLIEGEKTIRLDGIDWQKIEIYIYSQQDFKKINFDFMINSFFLEPTVQVSPMWIYEISESDYYNRKYFPLESIFSGKRPGEALLNPFINNFDNSDNFNYYRDVSSVDTAYSRRKLSYSFMNVSNIYEQATDQSGMFQIIPDRESKYKYYISDISGDDKGISAYYDQYLSVNKIYIKTNNVFSQYSTALNTSSFTIYFNKSDGTASSYLYTNALNFDSNGISVFYYKDNTWYNTSGSAFSACIQYAASVNSTANGGWLPPTIGNNGQIDSAQILTQMTGLAFKYDTKSLMGETEDNRLHLVEISPRLEIDITDYVESYNISKEMSNEDSGNDFPLGFITSNSGEIVINNFPVYYNNKPFSIFENRNSQTFLYDLLTQNVKFTGYFRSTVDRADFTKIIPSFVMYAENWSAEDINNLTVTIFDAMKPYLQSNESAQYVASSESLDTVINHLFAISGFSDYSRAELNKVCKNKTQSGYFWTEESKTVAQCLQELFISNQIGCYLDETGFMRFIDIDSIIDKKINDSLTTNFDISDIKSSNFPYLPNLIDNSYQETLGTTIGKIIINYRLPNSFTSPAVLPNQSSFSEQLKNISGVFSEESNLALGHTLLSASFSSSDLDLQINNTYLEKPRNNPGTQTGDFFVGCEAVKLDGHKYSFVVSGSPGYNFQKIIRYDSDINNAVQEVVGQFGKLGSNVKYSPTGYFPSVIRGCYGTAVLDHPIIKDNNASTYFTKYPNATFKKGACEITLSDGTSFIVPNLSAKLTNSGNTGIHNHFSFTFQALDTNSKSGAVGIAYYYDPDNSNSDYLLFLIEKNIGSDNKEQSSKFYIKTKINGKVKLISLNNSLPFISLQKKLFDKNEHRFSIWLNDNEIIIRTDDSSSVIKVKVDKSLYSVYNGSYKPAFFFSTQNAYGTSLDKKSQSIRFKEFYAADWPKILKPKESGIFDLKNNPKYHIQTETFLSNIMKGVNNEPAYYLWQDYPKLIGMKAYKNEKFQSAPALNEIIQSDFNGYSMGWTKSSLTQDPVLSVGSKALATSIIESYPFMFSQMLVNNTSPLNRFRTVIFLKANGDSVPGEEGNSISVSPYQIRSQRLFFTSDKKYERVIDFNHINNSIVMNTRWIQSEKDAKQLTKKISAILPQFNSTLQLEIFGNPLLQVGDVVGLWYSLKNLGFDANGNSADSLKYLVVGVRQFWDGGLNTQLSLKPIK